MVRGIMQDLPKVVRWLIEATSEPEKHRLGEWTLEPKTPGQIIFKYPIKHVEGWLLEAKTNPQHELSKWVLDPLIQNEIQERLDREAETEAGVGGFGITLPVIKTSRIPNGDLKLSGQAKFYFDEWSAKYSANMESLVLGELNSRFIPKWYDAGTTPGSYSMPYVVMERIDGYDLTDEKFKALSASQFRSLALDTLRALRYAQAKQYFHTDIKPANIMFSEMDSSYVVIDFGIAKWLKKRVSEGYVGGTEGYRAPEAYEETKAFKSDIYSLGLTFYFALTKKQPVTDALRALWAKKKPLGRELVLRDAEYQEVLRNMKGEYRDSLPMAEREARKSWFFDLSMLAEDQAHLISRMIDFDLDDRADLDELLGLANELKVGDLVFNPAQNDPWGVLSGQILTNINQLGLERFKLTLQEKKHSGLWIKVVSEEQKLSLVCNRPRNPISLSERGWRNYGAGMMSIPLDQNSDEHVRDIILNALKQGFKIDEKWIVTFG
jgi:serine/threonine protein kinase